MSRFPITIGVIGHLDAIINQKHIEAVIGLLDDLYKKYPNSPLILFSQLAKGADTWMAELFLNHGHTTQRDYQLIVPIPMRIDDYKQDFNEKELQKFEELRNKATRSFEVEEIDKIELNLSRDQKYLRGGKFVADSSMILIALFDGIENDLIGGTADIVYYRQNGILKQEINETLSNIQGSVILLSCNRKKSDLKNELQIPEKLFKNYIRKTILEKALSKIEVCNKNQKRFDNQAEGTPIFLRSNTELSQHENKLKGIFALWDRSSQFYQKKYFHNLKFLFVLGFVLFFFFEMYRKESFNEFYLLLIMAFIIIFFLIYNKFRGRNNHLNYIEDRVLAEALRVQFYWNLTKIPLQVTRYILRIHKKEYNWMNFILNATYGITYEPHTQREIDYDSIIKDWVIDQKKFFNNSISKYRSKNKTQQYLSWTLAVLALICFSFILFIELSGNHKEYESYFILTISLLVGSFVLTKGYYEKKGFDQIMNQYELMKNIFESTEGKVNNIKTSKLSSNEKEKQIKHLLFLTGREALVENGNWYLIFKDKELELEGI